MLCDGGAVGRGVADGGEVAGVVGALEDDGALEDGEVVGPRGGALLVLAVGAPCGCGVPPVVPQPLTTITAPAVQASSKRIRIAHLAGFSIGGPP